MTDDADGLVAGELLGRFRLLRKLGSGSHGTVWEAEDPLLSERLALKVLHPWRMHEPDARERLKREVILARRIVHPNVCRLYDLHEAGGTLFITMQFIDGRPLSSVVKDEGLSTARGGAILRKLASAIAAAHNAGVVHRDLKPSNVSIGKDDDVIVLDFGIASSHDLGRLTRPGLAVGTLRFLAPETWRTGAATVKSDQFALGVIGYIVLTRRMPWPQKDAAAAMLAVLKAPPSPIVTIAPEVPDDVADVIERAMAFDPERRFPDVAAFERALKIALKSVPAEGPDLSLPSDRTVISRVDLSIPEAASGDVQRLDSQPPPAVPLPALIASAAIIAVVVVVVGVVLGLTFAEPAAVRDAGVVVVAPRRPPPPPPPAPVVVDAGVAVAAVDPAELIAAQLKALQAAGRNAGLRTGDVAAWDEALARALASKKAPKETAERALRQARAVLDGVVIDRPFVAAKRERFNRAADQAVLRTPSLFETLRPYSKDINDKMAKGDLRGANRAISAAWVVVDKAKQ